MKNSALVAVTENSISASSTFNSALIQDFINYCDMSEKSVATYQRALKQFFKFIKAAPVYDDIVAFKKSLLDAGRKPTTVALYLAAVKKFMAWCEERGICKNTAQGVKSPKLDKGHKRDFLGARQLNNILKLMPRDTVEHKRNYAIFLLVVTCGLRTVEVTRADIRDIRTLGDNTVLFVLGKGKSSKSEWVNLPQETLDAINDYLKARGKDADTAPLFASTANRNKGGRLTTTTISNVCKAAMRAAGIDSPRITAHSLRHSAITLSLLNGHSLEETQAFARHSNITSTIIYNHSVNRMKSTIERDICSAIFRTQNSQGNNFYSGISHNFFHC